MKIAAEALAHALQSVDGTTLVYRRGLIAIELIGVSGSTRFDRTNELSEVVEQFESRDFKIVVADLIHGDTQLWPEEGDEIDEIGCDETLTYQVMAPFGEQPWRYADRSRVKMRVHTKQVHRDA